MKCKNNSSLVAGILLGILLAGGIMFVPGISWAPPLIQMGVVNWERVVSNYADFQNNMQDVEQRRENMIAFIEEQYGQLDEGEDDELSAEIDEMYRDTLLQIEERRQRLVQEAHQEILIAIEQEAIRQGYSLIFSENEVLYASEDYTDITLSVLDRLNS